eukprot:TRINITY_DN48051_c0_g1_i1.p1 TRINITY_DN48051_c0_g1~~TRINITY_DN48051_c0_g1_i1.p1  ORF type:complete len:365 (-),score=81.21 TRINITY_DN48051_c0_g1_i1:83-1147(-)
MQTDQTTLKHWTIRQPANDSTLGEGAWLMDDAKGPIGSAQEIVRICRQFDQVQSRLDEIDHELHAVQFILTEYLQRKIQPADNTVPACCSMSVSSLWSWKCEASTICAGSIKSSEKNRKTPSLAWLARSRNVHIPALEVLDNNQNPILSDHDVYSFCRQREIVLEQLKQDMQSSALRACGNLTDTIQVKIKRFTELQKAASYDENLSKRKAICLDYASKTISEVQEDLEYLNSIDTQEIEVLGILLKFLSLLNDSLELFVKMVTDNEMKRAEAEKRYKLIDWTNAEKSARQKDLLNMEKQLCDDTVAALNLALNNLCSHFDSSIAEIRRSSSQEMQDAMHKLHARVQDMFKSAQ